MSSIILNTRCLLNPMTGVQRYTSCILDELRSVPIETIAPCKKFSSGVLGHFWEQIVLPFKLKDKLLFSPANTGPIFYKKQIVTIHDIIPLDHPEWYDKKFAQLYTFLIPKIIRAVKHIITDSNFYAKRIIEVTKIDPQKISAIPLGVDEKFFAASDNPVIHEEFLHKFNLKSKKYVLSVCSISPRKNIKGLLHAWKLALPYLPPDIDLVLVGDELTVSSTYNIGEIPDRVHFVGRVDDDYLPSLYSNSLMFSFVSFCEGFGLPILEAMACGTPVLTSNITSMPEISGDAALLVDPFDVAAISENILKIVNDRDLRNKLIVKGIDRAKEFTWEKTAKLTLKVLENNL